MNTETETGYHPEMGAAESERRRKLFRESTSGVSSEIQADRPLATRKSATGRWGSSHWLKDFGKTGVSERD